MRWWDGSAWTDHLIDPTTGAAPVAATPIPATPVPHQPELPASTAATSSIAAAEIAPSGQPLTRRELREQEAAGAIPAVAPVSAVPPEPQVAVPVVQPAVAVQPPVPAAPMSSFDLLMSPAAGVPAVPSVPPQAAEPQPAFQQPAFQPQDAQPTAFPPAAFPAAAFPPAVPGPDEPWTASPVPQIADLFPARDEPASQPSFTQTPAAPTEVADDEATGSVSTFGIWLFAALPILHAALIWYVYERLIPTDTGTFRWVVLAGPIVVYLILAMLDRSRLVAQGHTEVPSPLFAIIPPIYLAFRVTRIGLRALPPAAVWLVLQVAVVVVFIVFFPSVVTHLTA